MMQVLVLAPFQRTPADRGAPGPDYPDRGPDTETDPDRHVGHGVCCRRHHTEGSGTVWANRSGTTWNCEPMAKMDEPTYVPDVAPGGTVTNRVIDLTCCPGQPGSHAPAAVA